MISIDVAVSTLSVIKIDLDHCITGCYIQEIEFADCYAKFEEELIFESLPFASKIAGFVYIFKK